MKTITVYRRKGWSVDTVLVEHEDGTTTDLTKILAIQSIEHNPITPGDPPLITFTIMALLVEEESEEVVLKPFDPVMGTDF